MQHIFSKKGTGTKGKDSESDFLISTYVNLIVHKKRLVKESMQCFIEDKLEQASNDSSPSKKPGIKNIVPLLNALLENDIPRVKSLKDEDLQPVVQSLALRNPMALYTIAAYASKDSDLCRSYIDLGLQDEMHS